MITDLVRNDLNRICPPDSVRVTRCWPRRSTIRVCAPGVHGQRCAAARRRLGRDPGGDVPAGIGHRRTEARAPLDVIRRPRAGAARPYCGAIGFVDADRGRAVLAVGIRTFFTASDPRPVTARSNFGTGAGITYPSDPDAEWRETELKAQRLIGLASPTPTARPAPAR